MDRPPDRPSGARQRWRVRYARDASAASLTQRDESDAWTGAIVASGLPAVGIGTPARPKLAFGPPLPSGARALREPFEVLLAERLPIAEVRAALARAIPQGHALVRLDDVWIGAPALAGLVSTLDYSLTVAGAGREELEHGIDRLLSADALPRERVRASGSVRYDLRPLVAHLALAPDPETTTGPGVGAGPLAPVILGFRARVFPDRGAGRPDEVVSALSDLLGRTLAIEEVVRTDVRLRDEAPRAEAEPRLEGELGRHRSRPPEG